ncbi:MAG: bifunctional (p)ppGpp synthetase/guanosine-3',5'-bis(diphosphate) 3'-pyrophosphohydrolase [Hyphomicrobiaceae bacterium]|nr:bifunctional (p)ppGpp synthetase/guanosine-3',5'-bis(diphosphate) 3'-pyrophosphohydrolase [Hyphomicrobiaceae bacterium]
MMRQYELTERVLSYDPKADEALLNRAYVYAMKKHGDQKRRNGDPYFSHPLEVAAILTGLKLDDATIATALLHDVIEDTDGTRVEIDQMFGPKIAELVDGLTKIKRLDLASKRAEQAENFRKLLLAISSDVRVLLVKLADRLHNMRTLEHNSPESRERNSQETLDIYAPLAGRIGMHEMREELEGLAFRWVNPQGHKAVTEKLAELRRTTAGLVEETIASLRDKLTEAGIEADVFGREKKPYAIWDKMVQKKTSIEKLSDVYAFRIKVKTVDECYRALGLVHAMWQAIPGRFKDYISCPKQNNYQSIHTTVIGPRNQRVELQIRTHRMHEIAEYGIAAHAIYKDTRREGNGTGANGHAHVPIHVNRDDGDESAIRPYIWLRKMVESLTDGSNPEETLEQTKLELFRDQVFCFTPKGGLIALPRGATPLDFAYAVHTDIGNIASGAIVNGRQVPIETKLRNGDEVEVLTTKGHVHPEAWEGFAVTGRAQLAIRRQAREAKRRRQVELGRRLLGAQFHRAGAEPPDDLHKLAMRFNQRTADDVLIAIARNEIPIDDAVAALDADGRVSEAINGAPRARRQDRSDDGDGWLRISSASNLKFRTTEARPEPGADTRLEYDAADERAADMPFLGLPAAGIPIRGLKDDVPVAFEPGGAVPGDRVIGVLTAEGILVFQIHSPRLKAYEHERWIDVTWDVDQRKLDRFPATVDVVAPNQPGILAQIAQIIGQAGGNIDKLHMVDRASDFTTMRILLGVYDLAHLAHIIAGLRSNAVVAGVERVFE